MNKICWKGRAFKALSYGALARAGRNFSGSITIFHRGGGSKKLLRRIDFERKNIARGSIERIEYDPNRTARIALVRWSNIELDKPNYEFAPGWNSAFRQPGGSLKLKTLSENTTFVLENHHRMSRARLLGGSEGGPLDPGDCKQRKRQVGLCWRYALPFYKSSTEQERLSSEPSTRRVRESVSQRGHRAFSYILACDKLKPGDEIFNIGTPRNYRFEADGTILLNQSPSLNFQDGKLKMKHVKTLGQSRQGGLSGGLEALAGSVGKDDSPFEEAGGSQALAVEHLYQKNGISLPLWLVPLGSVIHNIELYPGAGGKFARAAGTFAQLVQKVRSTASRGSAPHLSNTNSSKPSLCSIRLPSGQHQLLDVRCRATIGIVSNIEHNTRTFKKAGQSRWLGLRPVVRGVAMNPIDHPHGGGEGRTKGGRPSVSPWGKSAKGQRKGSAAKRRGRLR